MENTKSYQNEDGTLKKPSEFGQQEKIDYINDHGPKAWFQYQEEYVDNQTPLGKINQYAKNPDSVDSAAEISSLLGEVHPDKSATERVILANKIKDGKYPNGYQPE